MGLGNHVSADVRGEDSEARVHYQRAEGSGTVQLERPVSGLDRAVNLRDVAEGAADVMKPGLVFRSSQLVRAEELQDLGLRSCLDLRESKRKCSKVEKSDLRSESPSEGMSQSKKVRSRLRARAVFNRGKTPKPCRICSVAFLHNYTVDIDVYHADTLPFHSKLSVLKAVPLRISSRALLRLCLCEHPQKTMAPAVADDSQLGLSKLYPLLLDQSRKQVARAVRIFADPERLPCLVFCIHGKDRTGLLVILLLLLLDVPVETIKDDYTQSELELQGEKQDGNLKLDSLLTSDTMLQSHHSAVTSVAEHLQQFGGVRQYCLKAGLTSEELNSIRRNLLQRPGDA